MQTLVGIEEFANCCNFSLRGHVLTTTCHLRDKATGRVFKFERSVDLKPAIDYVTQQLHAWHLQQHGEDPAVSGWTDYVKSAVSTVRKVAQNKTVRSIYQEAKPFLKAAIKEVPGGETGLALASKAADVYTQAKKGSQAALQKVQQVKHMAEQGDPKAQFAVKVMKNVGTIIAEKLGGNPHPVLPEVHGAMQARRGGSLYHLGVTCVSGEEMPEEYNDVWNPHYDIVGSFWGGVKKVAKYSPPGLAFQAAKAVAHHPQYAIPGYAAYRGAKAAAHAMAPHHRKRPTTPVVDHRRHKQGFAPHPTATHPDDAAPEEQVPAPLAAQVTQPDFAPQSTTQNLPSDQYAEEQLFEDAYEGEFDEGYEGGDEEVSGWTYNRPYRTTPQMLVQARRSPGIALSVRELYNRGMGRPATDLSQLASAALSEF